MHNAIMEASVCVSYSMELAANRRRRHRRRRRRHHRQMRKMHIKCHFLMKAKHINKLFAQTWEALLSCVALRFLSLLSFSLRFQERHESVRSKLLFLLAHSLACSLYIQFLILLSSWCNQTKTRSERYLSMGVFFSSILFFFFIIIS